LNQQDIDEEIEILNQKLDENHTAISALQAENHALENTIALLKLKRSGLIGS